MAETTTGVYEISNPSDAYTITGDPKDAALATLILGVGRYGLTDKDGENVLPIFLFGGHKEWVKATFGHDDLGKETEARNAAIVESLRSVLIGGFRDREEYEAAISTMTADQRKVFAEKRHDIKRSSMNNIGKRAHALAEHLSQPRIKKV